VSALVPYKRIDLAIEACRLAEIPLHVVGVGPEIDRLRKLAGPEVRFFGNLNDEAVRQQYRQAEVFLLPGEEEFGIAPLEAQACGCPVIALNRGGAQETVINEVTGVLVDESTPEAFASALRRVRISNFDKSAIRTHALKFSEAHFLSNIGQSISDMLASPGAKAQ
jgi:glycosyltransferase involved in cell wall biosynthesis